MIGEPEIARVLLRGDSSHPATDLPGSLRRVSGEAPVGLRRYLRAAGDAPAPFLPTAMSPVLTRKLLWSVDIRLK